MAPSVALSWQKQAEQLRKDGNHYFKKDRFGAAIEAYTEVLLVLCKKDSFFIMAGGLFFACFIILNSFMGLV